MSPRSTGDQGPSGEEGGTVKGNEQAKRQSVRRETESSDPRAPTSCRVGTALAPKKKRLCLQGIWVGRALASLP